MEEGKKLKSGTVYKMGIEEQIRQSLKKMASEVGPDHSLLAQVKSVDAENKLCDLYDDDSDLDFYDVRLQPVIDGKQSIVLVPKVDSWVLAVRLEGTDDWAIVWAEQLEKYIVECDNVEFNGGENGGLVNWPDAKAQLDKSNEVLGIIMNTLTTWTPIPNDGGAALKTAFSTAIAGKTLGSFEDLEDTKVKH
jgi:hypothetical protein